MLYGLRVDPLYGFTPLHLIPKSCIPGETDIEKDYLQALPQAIQQLVQNGVDIDAKDIRVCAMSHPQEHRDMEGLLIAKLSNRQFG